MGACNRDCSKLTGQPLLTARTAETRPLRATASVFHAAKRLPLFATSIVHSAHNAEMSVGDIGCELSSYIRTVRESSARNGVDLPLIVLWADHGTHYGHAMERSAVGRAEHKFPTLVMLVPSRPPTTPRKLTREHLRPAKTHAARTRCPRPCSPKTPTSSATSTRIASA